MKYKKSFNIIYIVYTILIIISIFILYKYYMNTINTKIENYTKHDVNKKPYIWMFWETLPGYKKPGYIDLCYESVVYNCSNCFNIIYLDEKKLRQYIPDIDNYQINHLKIQHKADIYRYLLLEKYGGLWVDADILVLKCLCPHYKKLEHYDYVGFGCGYNKQFCSKSLYGYGSPLNWLMGSKPNTKYMKCIISNVKDKVKNNAKINYHDIGKKVLNTCHDKLRDKDNWTYYHVPSKCNEYNDDGTKLNNIFKNFDNSKCSSERYFFPFYNTAPGYPQWFKDLNCQELKTIDLPIKNIIKEAFSSKKKCKYT
jgi:hypothetical protein